MLNIYRILDQSFLNFKKKEIVIYNKIQRNVMVTRPMRNIAHVNYLFRLIFNKVRINNGAFLKKYSKLIVAGKSTIIRRRYRERMQKKKYRNIQFCCPRRVAPSVRRSRHQRDFFRVSSTMQSR